jgi:nitrogenase molybdenum-cofactor synthesis protein NifE
MLKQKIADVFNEPGCAKNQAKSDADRKKGCSTKGLTPGAAAGGCAFDGAKIALQPITDAAHIVHGPIACEGNAWDNRHAYSSGPQLYRVGFTTDMQDLDVISGGEKKLWKAIKDVIAKYDPPAVFVYQTCVPALIGDDVVKVCEVATEKLGRPIIPVNAPGFVGSKNLGNKLAGETLLDYVIGTEEPEPGRLTDTDINIIGDYNLVGELWQVEPLFRKCGINVLARITGDARYHEITKAHRARANMLLCAQAMVNVGRKMQERWGIPYYEGSFYGIEDMSASLRAVGRMLVERGADAALLDRVEAVVTEEEARCWERIKPYAERLKGKKVLLYTGGHKSWSIVSALHEMGMEVVRTSVRKATENDKAKALDLMDGQEDTLVDQIPAPDMYRMLKEHDADIMLSGGRTQFVALKARTPWLDINQERHYAYGGYDGMVELVRQMDKAVNNPVWAAVRAPTPWDGEGRLLR